MASIIGSLELVAKDVSTLDIFLSTDSSELFGLTLGFEDKKRCFDGALHGYESCREYSFDDPFWDNKWGMDTYLFEGGKCKLIGKSCEGQEGRDVAMALGFVPMSFLRAYIRTPEGAEKILSTIKEVQELKYNVGVRSENGWYVHNETPRILRVPERLPECGLHSAEF